MPRIILIACLLTTASAAAEDVGALLSKIVNSPEAKVDKRPEASAEFKIPTDKILRSKHRIAAAQFERLRPHRDKVIPLAVKQLGELYPSAKLNLTDGGEISLDSFLADENDPPEKPLFEKTEPEEPTIDLDGGDISLTLPEEPLLIRPKEEKEKPRLTKVETAENLLAILMDLNASESLDALLTHEALLRGKAFPPEEQQTLLSATGLQGKRIHRAILTAIARILLQEKCAAFPEAFEASADILYTEENAHRIYEIAHAFSVDGAKRKAAGGMRPRPTDQ